MSTILVGSGGFATIQAAIDAAGVGDTVLIEANTYVENVTLKSGVNVQGAGPNEGAVVIQGTLITPATYSNATVSMLTVHNASTSSMLLNMKGTSAITDVVFDHVTLSLTGGSFTGDVPIGNGQVSGSILLTDTNGDGAGLTFRHVTAASNNAAFEASTAFVFTLVHGAKMVLDDVTLTGTASGSATGLGAQWNMTPNTGETASVSIINSHTLGGGNFYVSGMDGVTITNNVFDGQGLALNGVTNATVTGNTFQNISNSLTANGTQHRGLTIENAWTTDGVSDVTVTGNIFTDITAADGAIAFQRWTDGGGNLVNAGIDALNDVAIHGNTFTGVTQPLFLNSGSFDAGKIAALAGEEQLIIGTADPDTIVDTSTGDMAIFADAGNDGITGGAGNDRIDGGTGTDTAQYAGTLAAGAITAVADIDPVTVGNQAGWQVNAGAAQGTDTLVNVEVVNDVASGRTLLVGSGGFATIQAAINEAATGDVILIAAGTYHENVVIGTGKDGITIVGQSGAILEGTFRQDNGLAPGASVANFLKTAVAYNGNSGAGITVSADNVTIQGLTVQSFLHGIALGDGSDHLRIEGVDINNTVMGVFKGDDAAVSNLELINGQIRDSYHGMIISKGIPSGRDLNGLLVQGTTFTNLVEKGLYFETLSDALITGIAMSNVGQFGRGPSFGASQVGGFGAGIDINLKWDHETSGDTVNDAAPYSNIVIENFAFTNVGSSNQDGTAASHFGGAAIAVKARDDAPSYNSPESASFSGPVVIQNGSINGTSVGIRAGEPNKAVGVDNVTGPAVNVSGVTINGASVADIDNSSQSVVTVAMHSGDTVLTARDSDRATGNIDVTGTGGTDTITTEKGNDNITGGAGSDVIDGGAGTDTAHYTGAVTATANGATWSINAGVGEGTDTLTNVEVVDDGAAGRILLVGSGGYATIQAAIDAATTGDTVLIAAGTYHENLVIGAGKDGITIAGQSGAILEGTFRQINGLAPEASVATFLKSAAAYTGTAPGVTVSADNVTIQGLTVRSFLTGIELGNGTDHLRIENVTIDGTVSGVRKGTGAAVSNLELVGGVIQDSYIGMYIAKEDASGQDLNGLLIQGTTFTNLVQKGLYFESLSGAQITGITMTNVGQWGRAPAFGGGGGFGNGIDINLKWDHEATGDTVNDAAPYSNIVIENFAFTNVGSSNQDGAAAPHFGGAAIAVKARDDSPSYSGPESASFSGPVIIQNGSINGTSVGIRAGEPNKAVGVDNVTGPAVNVSGVTINGASVADIDNSSQSVVTVAMAAGDTTLTAQDSDRSTGNVNVTGTGGTDNITMAKGNDNITGGAGSDVIDGKAGTDTVHYTGAVTATANGATWSINAGVGEGTDTLTNVEIVDDSAAGRILLVGSGGFASIQAAIDASADGDKILIAAGTYTEALSIAGKAITLQAAGPGVIVQAPVSSNAITLTGNFELGNVSILGIDVRGVAALPNQGIGVFVTEGANIGTLTLDGLTVQDAGAYGVFLDGEDSLPLPVAANVVITNSSFAHNGYNGANGAAHIKLFGFPGTALIQNVTITGAPANTPVAERPDYGIELTGTPNSFLSGGTTVPLGTVTLDNVTITGWLHKIGLAFYNYANLEGLTVGLAGAGHDVDLSGVVTDWGPALNIDGILANVDASGFNVVLPASTVSTELQGETAGQLATPQMITGTSANDRLMGKGGADHLKGGDGNDELYGHDKPGGSGVGDSSNDVLEGGTGNDQLYGGGGTDTAQYTGDLAGGSVTAMADADPSTDGAQAGWQVSAGAEGTDLLVGVEIVDDGAGGRILLAGSGGFATIQAAIDAAAVGDTVLIAAGSYIENVTLKSGVNVLGAGASESAVVIQGTVITPATFSNATVSMLTVQNASTSSMLLNMKGTSAITDVVFDHVTLSLTGGSFTGDVPIGNGQVSGSILLTDTNGDGAGLTFRHVTAASNNAAFEASTAFVFTLVHGAKMVLDDVTLTGTASGSATGLGAQWNMTPNTGETASVSIINSHTLGGGNFYVSGMDGVTIANNVFDGQGLALNGVTNATVTGNTFQNISNNLTANGTQHRGLTIENAWTTDGVSDVTVTGNVFTNITATDGAIAFQRWTDAGGNPVNASTALLNDIDIHGNTFTTVAQALFFSGSSFSAATIAALAGQSQLIIGTVDADTIVDQTGASAMIGGSGSDNFVYSPGGGATVVVDFAQGADKVDLTHIPGVFFLADVLSRANQVGADVVIDFGGGDVLTLSGVLKTSLAAADFVFAAIPVLTEQLLNDTGASAIDKITSDPALTGTGDANTLVSFKIDGNAIAATVMADAGGAWSFTPTGLVDGSHTIEASQTNGLGNTGTVSLTFTLDKTIVTATVALTNDTGSSGGDKITSDASLTVSAAAADVTRTYVVNGGLGSATYTAPSADGSYTVLVTDADTAGNVATASITFTLDKTIATPTVALANDTGSSGSDKISSDASLAVSAAAADVTRTFIVDGGLASATYIAPTSDGSHTVVVTDTDTAGNVATASVTFTLDKTIATPTVALTQDTGGSGSDKITSDASLTVSAAAADVTRVYTVDGGVASGTYTAPAADGGHTVLVTDTDTAGNVATASITFTLDKTIATPTVTLANDTGSSGSDKVTNDASLAISEVAADVTRTFSVDGGAVSGTYAAPTTGGSHTVVVTDTDTAGNVATASITFTLNKTIATPAVALVQDTGSSGSDGITSNASLAVSVAAADVTRTYIVDGGAASGSYTAPTADGSHTVLVTDTDSAGNVATASITFTLDKTIATPTVALANDTGSSSSDGITSDASLTVGAAAADVTFAYIVDGGAASASYTAPTVDGSHTVVVVGTDTAGNVATASITFTLNKTIATPAVALVQDTGSSGSDGITRDASLTVSEAAADVTRTYSVNGAPVSGSYTAPTADGSHTVVVTDTDSAGNVATASITFTLDKTIATPTVALANDTGSSSSDGITSDASLTVSAAAADVIRTYSVDGGAASGTYAAPTANGSHTVLVTDTDTAGNVATSNIIFTLAGAIATPTVALANDTGSSGSDEISSDASLIVSEAAPDVTRTYTVDGGPASGTYAAPTTDGSHTVVVTDTDTAGNVATASITFTLDKTIANATVALANDTGGSGGDKITSDASLAISEAAADVTRTYSVNGAPVSGSYTAPTADGSHTVVVTDTDTAGNVATASITFTLDKTIATPTVALANDTGSSGSDGITSDASLTVSAAAPDVTRTYSVDGGAASGTYAAPTADGSHTVLVTDTDTAGNVATASIAFTLDKTIATPTVALANDTGSSGSDGITSDASLTVGAAAADVTRTYSVDGGAASGTYAAPTTDGSHTVVVTDTDTAGNVATASIIFTLDKTIAIATVALANDTGSSGSDGITSDASLTVSAAAPDVTRTYSVDGGAASGTYAAPTTDGSHTVVVTDTDTAGNVATASITFTLDKTIATPTVALASDTGSSGSDKLTNDASLTVGAAAADVTRTYSVDGGAASGTYAAPTADGSHTVVVTDTDTAGNVDTASVTFTLDATAPGIAITSTGGATKQAAQTISGTADPALADETVHVFDGASEVASATVGGDGTWTVNVTLAGEGNHTITAKIADDAGNTGTSAGVTYALHTVVPVVTQELLHDAGALANDKITNDATLKGTGAPDVVVTFTVDGVAIAGTALADGSGAWSFTPTGLGDGTHTVVATQTDGLGGTGSATLTFTLDTKAPDIAVTSTGGLTNKAVQTVSGTADPALSGQTVHVFDGASEVATATVGGDGSWTTTVTMAGQGAHTISAKIGDLAGNTGSSANILYTVDTIAPVVTQQLLNDTGTSPIDKITSDATVTGLGDANALVTFKIDGVAVAQTATADGSGAWSFTPLGLADGTHTIVASQTDGAGNVGSTTLTFTLDTTAPSAASISATSASQPEGNTGTTSFTFLVQLDHAQLTSQTMNWSVTGSGGNPAGASDFVGGVLPSGTITIGAGETSAFVTVKVQGDKATEVNEQFAITLSNPSAGVTIVTGTATSTIENDDNTLVDGYISGATVFVDANGNGKLDPGEASTTTDANGNFSSLNGSGPLVAFGGVDMATGLAFVGSLSAPTGSSVITPVTTLITALQASGIADLAEAKQVANAILGLDPGVDSLNIDPIAAAVAGDEAAAAAIVAGAKLLDTAQLIVSAVGDGGDKAAAFNTVFGAMAAAIGDLKSGEQYNLSDTATLTTLVTDVATAQGTDASAIAGDLATIIAASNASLDQKLEENSSGLALFTDISAVARVALGETANDLQAAAGDPTQIAEAVANHTGDSLTDAIAVAAVEVAPATVTVVVEPPAQAEGDSGTRTYTFTLTLDHGSISDQTLVWSVAGIGASAASASDFAGGVLPGGIVTFAAGETSKTIEVSVTGDTTVEPDETFALTLSEPSLGLIVGTASTVGTIGNDDTSVAVVASAATKAEGTGGTTAFTFTVTRSGDTSVAHSVAYGVTGSGANPAAASDFAGGVLPSGVVSFAVGETTKTITIDVAGDAGEEPDEGFAVTLSDPSTNLTIGIATATAVIGNDDATVSIAALSAVVAEGNAGPTEFTFTVTRSGDTSVSASVAYAVTGSGANPAAASDFVGAALPSGIVTFAVGETSKTVTMSIAGDVVVESDEGFTVSLSAPSAGLVLGTASATATVVNDDTSVSIAALLASKVEGNAGSMAFTFTVTRSGDTSGVSTVAYAVAGSGATQADAADFVGGVLPSGVVTFAAGETTRTISVDVAGDGTVEPDNGFVVTLSTPSAGTTIGTASATGSVLNDDLRSYDDAYVVLQGHALTVSASAGVLANDDTSPPATATVEATTAHGQLQLAADGAVTYNPDAAFAGIDSFTYHAGGANGAADDGHALVYVVPVQVGPTATTLSLVALSAEEQIAATYVAFFGRGADAGGFAFWVDQFQDNQATQGPAALFANIASSFGISAEAKDLYPFLVDPFHASDAQIGAFLDTVYDNLFNRAPDVAGLNYWVNQIKTTLAAGKFVGSVLVDIMSGAQNTGDGQDITTVMGKVAVGLEFVQQQQEHGMTWAGAADDAAARALLDPVTSDAQSILTGLRNAETIVEQHG